VEKKECAVHVWKRRGVGMHGLEQRFGNSGEGLQGARRCELRKEEDNSIHRLYKSSEREVKKSLLQ
jgi:hypothetical protein